MLSMLRRQFSSTLAVFLALVALPVAARAEDGYDLWLRYAPIESAPLRDAYRQAIAGLVVQQTPATGAIVTKEVQRALKGLDRRRRAGLDRRHRRRRAGHRHGGRRRSSRRSAGATC